MPPPGKSRVGPPGVELSLSMERTWWSTDERDDFVGRQVRHQFPGYPAFSETSEGCRRWCLEWTFMRVCPSNHNPDVEEDAEDGEGDDDACDGGVDGPHVT